MNMNVNSLGDFVIFGFTQDAENFLKHRLTARLGIIPRTIDFGSQGRFFFYASYGDVAEAAEAIALKLGFARSPTRSPLSAQQLLERKIVKSASIDPDALRGSALIAGFSKIEPAFSVYQTLLISPALYYTRMGESVLCSTNLRCLLALLDQVQLNEDAVPMHFLFESVIGPTTYFQDIWRLFPGQMLSWKNGKLEVKLARNLSLPPDVPTFKRFDSNSVKMLYEGMKDVLGMYLAEIETSGCHFGHLLSGGVDSSVLQLLINDQQPQTKQPRSFSYAVQADSFEFEIEYARHASDLLQTQHTYFHILPQDYPDLLIRTIETLGQPNLMYEGEICKLALAESLAKTTPDLRYFFTGQGADGLHGMAPAKKMALLDTASRIPGSRLALLLAALLVAPVAKQKAHGLQDVAQMLAEINKPHSLTAPPNNAAIAVNLDPLRRYFGDQALLKALDYRNNLEAQYLNSPTMLEKTQLIDLLTASYEPAIVGEQVFAANGKRLIQPFLDEDVVLMTFAIDPKVRFTKGLTTKPFLKKMLADKSLAVLAEKKKGASVFRQDLYDWMKHGPLYDMMQAIDLPGFVSKSEFNKLMGATDKFLWNLLTLDIFQKRVLKSTIWK